MKIGLVLPYNIAKGGGVKEVVLALHDGLVKKGHDVTIITPQPREPYEHDDRTVLFLGTAADFKMPSTTGQISASMMTDEIDAMLEEQEFDILHFHEPWVPVLSRQILSRSRTVNVATFHSKLPETLVSRTMAKVITPYTKPLLRYIDAFTAPSDAAAEYVRSLSPVEVQIIPNGIDLQHFRPSSKPAKIVADKKGALTILYVGRLEKRKGVNYLLSAFKLMLERLPNVHLVLAGDGVDREKLEDQVAELQLESHVTFLGFVSEAKKLELLQTADLFCSPAIYGESFGIVLLEAMASGLVTVAGNNPGYESVMQDLGKLSLIDPKDTSAFAHRLQLLLTENDLRSLWKKWAKETVRKYDYPRVINRYEAAYEAALERKTELSRHSDAEAA